MNFESSTGAFASTLDHLYVRSPSGLSTRIVNGTWRPEASR